MLFMFLTQISNFVSIEYYLPWTELGFRVREGKSINNFFFETLNKHSFRRECYVHNIFTTFSQQIVSSMLLLVVMSDQKSNLSYGFKLEPITTYRM